MNTFFAMVKKDFQLLFTDKVTLFFTFIFPLLFAGLFGNMMGGGKSTGQISVAIVQEDHSEATSAFVETLTTATELKTKTMSLTDAQEAVRKGDLTAYLVLPEGFGDAYNGFFRGKTPSVTVGVDPKRTAEAGLLEGVLMKYGAERFKTLFSSNKAMNAQIRDSIPDIEANAKIPVEWKNLLREYLPKIQQLLTASNMNTPDQPSAKLDGFIPLKIEHQSIQRDDKGPKNAQAIFFPQAMLWAILGCIMGFGTSLVQENTTGTMLRMRVAPVSPFAILFGKSLSCAITIAVVIAFLVVIGMNVFGMPMQSFGLFAVAVFSIAICFSGLMMLIAAVAKTEQGLNGLGWAVLMVFAMVGGAMLPLFLMPEWLQNVSHFSPVKWAILSLEGAVWRNFSLQEMLLPCTVLLCIGVLAYTIGVHQFKRSNDAV